MRASESLSNHGGAVAAAAGAPVASSAQRSTTLGGVLGAGVPAQVLLTAPPLVAITLDITRLKRAGTMLPITPLEHQAFDRLMDDLAVHVSTVNRSVADINRNPADEELYRGNIKDQLQQIRTILQTLNRPPYTQDRSRITAIISVIERSFTLLEKDINHRIATPDSAERANVQWQTHGFHAEQSLIEENDAERDALEKLLQDLSGVFTFDDKAPQCFISYAWPTPENQVQEYWVQPFLKCLRSQLRLAGIQALLDIEDNITSRNIRSFAEQLSESDYAISFCTESLKDKDRSPNYRVIQRELNLLKQKHDSDVATLGQTQVLYVLGSGDHHTGYPEELREYRTVYDWRDKGYAKGLETLLCNLYGFRYPRESTDHQVQWEQFDALWTGFYHAFPDREKPLAPALIQGALVNPVQVLTNYSSLSMKSRSLSEINLDQKKELAYERYLMKIEYNTALDNVDLKGDPIPIESARCFSDKEIPYSGEADITRLYHELKKTGFHVVAGAPGIGKSTLAAGYVYAFGTRDIYPGGIIWFNAFIKKGMEESKLKQFSEVLGVDSSDNAILKDILKDNLKDKMAKSLFIFDDANNCESIADNYLYLFQGTQHHYIVISNSVDSWLRIKDPLILKPLSDFQAINIFKLYLGHSIDEILSKKILSSIKNEFYPSTLIKIAIIIRTFYKGDMNLYIQERVSSPSSSGGIDESGLTLSSGTFRRLISCFSNSNEILRSLTLFSLLGLNNVSEDFMKRTLNIDKKDIPSLVDFSIITRFSPDQHNTVSYRLSQDFRTKIEGLLNVLLLKNGRRSIDLRVSNDKETDEVDFVDSFFKKPGILKDLLSELTDNLFSESVMRKDHSVFDIHSHNVEIEHNLAIQRYYKREGIKSVKMLALLTDAAYVRHLEGNHHDALKVIKKAKFHLPIAGDSSLYEYMYFYRVYGQISEGKSEIDKSYRLFKKAIKVYPYQDTVIQKLFGAVVQVVTWSKKSSQQKVDAKVERIYASCLGVLASLLFYRGIKHYEESRHITERSLIIKGKYKDLDPIEYAIGLRMLGDLDYAGYGGTVHGALENYKNALSLSVSAYKAMGPGYKSVANQQPFVIKIKLRLARTHCFLGNFFDALDIVDDIIQSKSCGSLYIIPARIIRAKAFFYRGFYKESQEECHRISKELLSSATSFSNSNVELNYIQGRLYNIYYSPQKALNSFIGAYKILAQLTNTRKDPVESVESYDFRVISKENSQVHDLLKSYKSYNRIIHQDGAKIAHYIGFSCYKLGQYDVARFFYSQAKAINAALLDSNPKTFLSDFGIASIEYQEKKYDSAYERLDSLVTSQGEGYKSDHLEIANTHRCIARTCIKKGLYEKANENLNLAFSIWRTIEKRGEIQIIDRANANLYSAYLILLLEGNPSHSEEDFISSADKSLKKSILELKRIFPDDTPHLLFFTHKALSGYLEYCKGDYPKSFDLYREAVQIINRMSKASQNLIKVSGIYFVFRYYELVLLTTIFPYKPLHSVDLQSLCDNFFRKTNRFYEHILSQVMFLRFYILEDLMKATRFLHTDVNPLYVDINFHTTTIPKTLESAQLVFQIAYLYEKTDEKGKAYNYYKWIKDYLELIKLNFHSLKLQSLLGIARTSISKTEKIEQINQAICIIDIRLKFFDKELSQEYSTVKINSFITNCARLIGDFESKPLNVSLLISMRDVLLTIASTKYFSDDSMQPILEKFLSKIELDLDTLSDVIEHTNKVIWRQEETENEITSICVYCGTSENGPLKHKKVAKDLGRKLARADIEVVFGGAKYGLMRELADGTIEAEGKIVGVTTYQLDSWGVNHPGVTRLIKESDYSARKKRMRDISSAFIALPGGLGTLDEISEVLINNQFSLSSESTKKYVKPVCLVNIDGFFDPYLDLLKKSEANNYLTDTHLKCLCVSDSVDEILQFIHDFNVDAPDVSKWWEPNRLVTQSHPRRNVIEDRTSATPIAMLLIQTQKQIPEQGQVQLIFKTETEAEDCQKQIKMATQSESMAVSVASSLKDFAIEKITLIDEDKAGASATSAAAAVHESYAITLTQADYNGILGDPNAYDELVETFRLTQRHHNSVESSPANIQSTFNESVNFLLNRVSLFVDSDDKIRVIAKDLLRKALTGTGFNAGSAISTGDCFFDACAQALNEVTQTQDYTHESLRRLTGDQAKALEVEHPAIGADIEKLDRDHNWIYQALGKNERLYQQYLLQGGFTAEETRELKEAFRIGDGYAVWGEQHIDGPILSQALDICLHIIEIHDELIDTGIVESPILHQLIDADGVHQIDDEAEVAALYQKEKTIHLIVYRNHFVPALQSVNQSPPEVALGYASTLSRTPDALSSDRTNSISSSPEFFIYLQERELIPRDMPYAHFETHFTSHAQRVEVQQASQAFMTEQMFGTVAAMTGSLVTPPPVQASAPAAVTSAQSSTAAINASPATAGLFSASQPVSPIATLILGTQKKISELGHVQLIFKTKAEAEDCQRQLHDAATQVGASAAASAAAYYSIEVITFLNENEAGVSAASSTAAVQENYAITLTKADYNQILGSPSAYDELMTAFRVMQEYHP